MAYTTASVNAWYQAVQFQNGPTATVNSWVSGLNAGTITPAQVQNSIITQDAYTSGVVNPVLRLYQSSFNSVPDQAGQAYWVGQFGSGAQTYAQIANGFANSTQFKSIYANTSSTQIANTAQVTLLYQNILQRLPDNAGLAYWTTQTIGTALAGISSSPEMINASSLPIQNFQAAEIAGTASGSGSLYNYPGFPTTTYVLTTGIDAPGVGAFATSTGVSVGSNASVFGSINNGTATTYNPGDQITANAGTQNTSLTLSDGTVGAAPTDITSVAATVTNIPTVTVNSSQGILFNSVTGTNRFTGTTQLNINNAGADTITAAGTTGISVNNSALGAAAIAVNGGNAVSVTSAGGTTGTITVGGTAGVATTAAAGNVVVNAAAAVDTSGGAVIQGQVTVFGGGRTITVNETLTNVNTSGANINAGTQGAVVVTGGSTTTSVTVTQSAAVAATTNSAAVAASANANNALAARTAVALGAVTINDANAGSTTAAGTIASVTLQNYDASTISSSGLTTLSLSNTSTTDVASGTLGVTYGLATGNPTSLALNLGGGSLGALTLGTNITTVNSTLTANTTLAGITNTGLRTLSVAGTGILTVSGAINSAITSITNTSTAAGLNANVSGATGLTTLNFSTTSANNTITLNAQTQAYTGGSGVDTITIGADALRAISGGTGTADVLVLSATSATYTASSYTTNVSGFETLRVTNAAGLTYSMANWTGFTAIQNAGASNTFSNVAANTALTIYQLAATTTVYTLAGTNGSTASVNVNLAGTTVTAANGGGTAGYTTAAITLQDANLVGIGTVNINSDASVFQGLHTISTLTDNALTNLNITGTGSLSIGAASTAATSLTISDNGTGTSATADGIVTLTASANTLGSISYSGSHAFTIGTLVNNVANLTIANANTGTTGVLTIGGHTNTNAGVGGLTLTGSVAYTGTSASTVAFTVSAAGDSQNINWQVSAVGNAGVKTVTTGSGNDVILTGSAADIINVGTGTDLVRAGAGADQVTFGAGADTFQLKTAAGAGGAESGSFTTPGTNTISTTTFDVYTGLKVGDNWNSSTTASAGIAAAPGTYATGGVAATTVLSTTVTHLTDVSGALGGDNTLTLIRGTYSSAANTFVGSSTGADTLAVLDTNSTLGAGAGNKVYEAIVLVGYADNSIAAVDAAGLITL